jgi:aryl-alcohol dehydrogenase-like predicted oxidoreductase
MKQRYAGFDNDRGWNTLDAVRAIAKEKNSTPSAVALRWLLAKPSVTSVIFGARSLEQLDENLLAADVQLTAAEVAKLDDVSSVDFGYPYNFMANIQKRW